jgi:hypothetical protein
MFCKSSSTLTVSRPRNPVNHGQKHRPCAMTLALKQMHCGGKSKTQAPYIKSEGIQITSMFVFPLRIGAVYSVVLAEEYASARNDWTPVSTSCVRYLGPSPIVTTAAAILLRSGSTSMMRFLCKGRTVLESTSIPHLSAKYRSTPHVSR